MALTKPRAYQIYDIDYKQATRVITVANITLSGGAPSQVDGVNLSLDDRVLVIGQTNKAQNGIYEVSTVGTGSNGTWVRSGDTNSTGELLAGTIVMVTEGLTYADTQWKLITDNPIVIGVSELIFEQNSAYAFGNVYANGTAVLANSVGDTLTITAGNNISIVGNNTSKTVTIGVTGISLNSISNGTSNVNVVSSGGNITVGVAGTNNVAVFGSSETTFAGNVLPAANVTYSLGSSTQRWKDLWVSNSTIYLGEYAITTTGNALVFNNQTVITANSTSPVVTTGNVTGGNLITGGIVSASGNVIGGNLTTAGQVVATGNITGGNLNISGNIVDTGPMSLITGASGNINLAPNGTNTLIATTTGANITGTLSVTGNITGGNLLGTSIAGTLTTAAQTNITSVGTLSALTVTANIAGGNLTTAGQVAATGNITGGNIIANGRPLTSLNATNIDTGTLSQARLANSSVTLGSTALTLGTTVTTVAGLSSVTSTTFVGALTGAATTAGTVTTAAQPNITSVGTLSSLTVTANVAGGNLTTAGQVTATGNITGGNLLVNGNTVITGNLRVDGTETIFNVQTLSVNDKDIIVANNVTGGANVNGAGIQAGNPGVATWFFNNATTSWQSNIGITPSANGTLSLGGVSNYWGTAYLTAVSVSGNANVGNLGATTVVATTLTGTLSTAAQTNITSVGTLSSLTVTANVAGGNLTTAGQVVATGNVSGGNLNVTGNIVDTGALSLITGASGNINLAPNGTNTLVATTTGANVTGTLGVTGNITGGNLSGTSIVGTLLTAAQTNITSVGTLGSLTVTANVAGGNITTAGQVVATGNVSGGNLNVTGNIVDTGALTVITGSSGNINLAPNGTNTLIATTTGANVTGTLTVTGNVTGGNLVTAGQISATGTITSTGSTNGTGFAVGNSAVSNVGLGFFPTAGTRGDYAIRDYSNVTSTMYFDVGMGGSPAGEFQFRTSNAFTLLMRANSTGVYSPGVVSATGIVSGLELTSTQSSGDEGGQINLAKPATNNSLGGNIIVDIYQNRFRIFENGGTNRGAYIDLTSCNASVGTNLLVSGGGGTPGGSNTQVQFNDGGVFGGNSQFTYDKVTNILTAGTIAGTLNGAGQNFKVGDDAWIGDINLADTIGLKGQQNAANAYIVFGNSDSTGKLGRSGTGPLTYSGAFTATGNISGGNLSGTSIVGTLTTAAQTNITSVGTLDSLTVTANVAGGNLTTAGQVVATGNVTGGNLRTSGVTISSTGVSATTVTATANVAGGNITTGGNVVATGNVAGGNVAASTAVFSFGTVTATANVAGGNITTAGQVVATGNVSGGNLNVTGNIVDTGPMSLITAASGNINLAPNGTNTLIATTTGANITGTLNATGNANVGNLGAATVVATTLTGTLSTASQPNITSVGTLGSLAVTGNISGGNLSITNDVTIGGNLSVTGNATLSGNILGDRIQNGTTSIDIQTPSGNANISVGGTSNVAVFSTTGANITGALGVTGNITGGNILGNGAGLTGINAFSNVTVTGGNSAVADSIADTLTLTAGDGIAITIDSTTDTITIAASGGSEIFVDGADFGTVTEAVTLSDDLGLVTEAVDSEADLGSIVTSGLIYPDQFVLPSYTTTTLPSASIAGAMIYVSNETGGAVPAFSDGTNWRRVTDRAIVS
jgi:hypothetical protein